MPKSKKKSSKKDDDKDVKDAKDTKDVKDSEKDDDDGLLKIPADELKELRAARRKLKELEAKQKDAEEKALEEQKKYQELAEKRKSEIEELNQKLEAKNVDDAINAELAKAGISGKQALAARNLIDRSGIKTNDDGKYEGIVEAVKAVADEHDYLLSNSNTNLGGGSNPPNPNNKLPGKYKLSQLQDTKFYQENYKDIQTAMARGEIVDDLGDSGTPS